MPPELRIEKTFVAEVLELHGFLQQWLRGEIDSERGLGRLENALDDDFVVIQPDGSRAGKRRVIRNFSRAHASKRADFALEISAIDVRCLGEDHGLVTYREDHKSEPGRERFSTALLKRCGDLTKWLFLQETLISPDS